MIIFYVIDFMPENLSAGYTVYIHFISPVNIFKKRKRSSFFRNEINDCFWQMKIGFVLTKQMEKTDGFIKAEQKNETNKSGKAAQNEFPVKNRSLTAVDG